MDQEAQTLFWVDGGGVEDGLHMFKEISLKESCTHFNTVRF